MQAVSTLHSEGPGQSLDIFLIDYLYTVKSRKKSKPLKDCEGNAVQPRLTALSNEVFALNVYEQQIWALGFHPECMLPSQRGPSSCFGSRFSQRGRGSTPSEKQIKEKEIRKTK